MYVFTIATDHKGVFDYNGHWHAFLPLITMALDDMGSDSYDAEIGNICLLANRND